jgi:hypothetical protein
MKILRCYEMRKGKEHMPVCVKIGRNNLIGVEDGDRQWKKSSLVL